MIVILRVLLLVILLAVPVAGEAQPATKVSRVGLLEAGSLAGRAPLWDAFRQAMSELGYVEGRTVSFEPRAADSKLERLPALAAELVRLKVDVIVTAATAEIARKATATIPIVMATGTDPVGFGLVASLSRPGGNVTGITTLTRELSAKRFELARELVPGASRLAILGEVGSRAAVIQLRETAAAAQALGVRLYTVSVRGPAEFDGAFSTIARERPAVLLVVASPMFFGERRRLADLALRHRLPTLFSAREFAEAGGLVAYGAELRHGFRRAAVYVDKILKGARPGELPLEQPTSFELVFNAKTAKALGLTIPASLLQRADQVVE